MSHSKQRVEKNCLNCGTEVQGHFCQNCGQENIEPKETLWSLISHFFSDITHFDGKFFKTLKTMIRKPGFLPKEYMAGRRATYLHPIRMYVFSSFVFFLVFFNLESVHKLIESDKVGTQGLNSGKIDRFEKEALFTVENQKDSQFVTASMERFRKIVKNYGDTSQVVRPFQFDLPKPKNDTTTGTKPYRYKNGDSTVLTSSSVDSTPKSKKDTSEKDDSNVVRFNRLTDDDEFKNKAEYDSAQKALPEDKRDSWFERQMRYKNFQIDEKYKGDDAAFINALIDKFLHKIPAMLFVSLPLYAFFLWLMYRRKHKEYYFADHGMFLIYLYIYTFLFLLVLLGIQYLRDKLDWTWLNWVMGLYILYGLYYTYRCFRNFYGQSRSKTLVKFIILNILAIFTLMLLFTIFFGWTVFQA